ncbi:hypothetical protein RQP46_000075 [Phenoliferia psychrophenolica]
MKGDADVCAICNVTPARFSGPPFVCSQCKRITFCSFYHQSILWPTHLYLCNPHLPLTFAQPALQLDELRTYILGRKPNLTTSNPVPMAETVADFEERLRHLVHPTTSSELSLLVEKSFATIEEQPRRRGKIIVINDSLLQATYEKILQATQKRERSDITAHVRRSFVDGKSYIGPVRELEPCARHASLFLQEAQPGYSSESILVLNEGRNAFELQALTVMAMLVNRLAIEVGGRALIEVLD